MVVLWVLFYPGIPGLDSVVLPALFVSDLDLVLICLSGILASCLHLINDTPVKRISLRAEIYAVR